MVKQFQADELNLKPVNDLDTGISMLNKNNLFD